MTYRISAKLSMEIAADANHCIVGLNFFTHPATVYAWQLGIFIGPLRIRVRPTSEVA